MLGVVVSTEEPCKRQGRKSLPVQWTLSKTAEAQGLSGHLGNSLWPELEAPGHIASTAKKKAAMTGHFLLFM